LDKSVPSMIKQTNNIAVVAAVGNGLALPYAKD